MKYYITYIVLGVLYFDIGAQLPTEMNELTKQMFHCNCGRSYQHNRSLWRHQKFECGKDPQYTCSICGAKFKHKNHFKVHYFLKHKNSTASQK